MACFRFGYYSGGDGQSQLRVDLREAAGFARHAAAVMTNFLLPVKVGVLHQAGLVFTRFRYNEVVGGGAGFAWHAAAVMTTFLLPVKVSLLQRRALEFELVAI